jgi:hypothetical protein
MERFNLKTLNAMKGKEKYRVEVFALQDLDSGVDIKST